MGNINLANYLFFIFFLCLYTAQAQFYAVGENPSSIHWRQINTENFQVIFDENSEENGQKLANLLEQVYHYASENMEVRPPKVSVILQSHLVTSNGFMTLAPRRSEIYQTYPQDNDVLDWLGLLAIHEFRHVVQMDKLNQGITKLLSILLGEQGRGLTFGLTMPLWFMEGDAVGTETALSGAGRGRLPKFEMELRAQLLEKGAFHYDKASFGSYRDIVTSHYPMGYFLTTYVKKHYGRMAWSCVLDRVGKQPFYPFRFSTALKKETGLSTEELYQRTIHEMDSLWRVQDNFEKTQYTKINQRKGSLPTHYHFPRVQEANKIIAVKSGFAEVPQFVQLDSMGNEQTIYTPINYEPYSFSYQANKLLWLERIPDARWGYRNFTRICLYDLETKKAKVLYKGKYFAPALSPNGKLVVCVEYNEKGKGSIIVWDIEQKKEIIKKPFEQNEQVKMPIWLSNNEIAYVHFSNGKNTIHTYNIQSQTQEELLIPQSLVLANLAFDKEHIYFESSFSGIQNIYAVHRQTKQVFQVTKSRFGAFEPFVFEGELYYADYHSYGYDVVKTKLNQQEWIPLEKVKNTFVKYYEVLEEQEGFQNVLDTIQTTVYESKKYYKGLHLLNIHSWQPVAIDEQAQKATLGAELKSQNKLSSTILHYRYQYIPNESLSKHELDITYNAWYPKLSLTPYHNKYNDFVSSSGTTFDEVYLRGVRFSIQVPQQFVAKHFYHVYAPFVQGEYANQLVKQGDLSGEGDFLPTRIGLQTTFYGQSTYRDFNTPWLLQAFVLYGKEFKEGEEETYYALLRTNIPTFKHHVLKTSVEYEQIGDNALFLQNRTAMPRGFLGEVILGNVWGVRTDYAFPIAYPDKRISFLSYIHRIKANVFFDYVQHNQQNYSYGMELSFDTNLLRYSYLMDIGIRVSLPQGNRVVFEPTFDISF